MKTAYVLLAGGNSETLFPISRASMPKQFKKYGKHNIYTELTEEQEVMSTFQETVDALRDKELYVITHEKYRFHVQTQLSEINKNAKIILQPDDGDINDAIRLAFLRTGADRIIFFPTDQVILEKEKFRCELDEFVELSRDSPASVMASKTVTPNHRFGYVLPENPEEKFTRVKDYVEKPENYAVLLKNGYLPSTGITSIKKPDSNAELADLIKKNASTTYISTYRWFEVNTIAEIEKFTTPDRHGNTTIGDAQVIESTRTTIYNEGGTKVIAAGLDNIEITHTGDVTLVINKELIPEYDKIIEEIKKKNPEIFETSPTVYKPWGRYTSLFKSKYFQIKILELHPGARISLQKHYHRSEHWIVVSGAALVRVGDKEKILRPGESTYVPIGEVHQLSNPGKIPLKVVEIQYGEYLEEDDIVRIKDDYGRK